MARRLQSSGQRDGQWGPAPLTPPAPISSPLASVPPGWGGQEDWKAPGVGWAEGWCANLCPKCPLISQLDLLQGHEKRASPASCRPAILGGSSPHIGPPRVGPAPTAGREDTALSEDTASRARTAARSGRTLSSHPRSSDTQKGHTKAKWGLQPAVTLLGPLPRRRWREHEGLPGRPTPSWLSR